MIMKKYVKRNGKLDWRKMIIFKIRPLLVHYRLVYEFRYCKYVLSLVIFFQLQLQVNIMLQRQEYLTPWIFFDLFMIHIPYYWLYLIIQNFDNIMYNDGLYYSMTQNSKSFCHLFTANNQCYGCKTYS